MNFWKLFLIILLTPFFLQFSVIDKEYNFNKKGIEYYKKKDFNSAVKQFENAELLNPQSPLNKFNKSTALAKQQNYDEALRYLEKTINNEKTDKTLKSEAHYNIGNILVEQQKYSDAIEHYKNALKINPNHLNAKYNLTYALNMLQRQQQQQNQKDKNDKSNENDKKKDDQQKSKSDNEKNKQDQKQQKNNFDKEQAEQLLNSIINSNKMNEPQKSEKVILKGYQDKPW